MLLLTLITLAVIIDLIITDQDCIRALRTAVNTNPKKPSKINTNLWQKIAAWKWCPKGGWIVRSLTRPDKIKKILNHTDNPITFAQYLQIKQLILNLIIFSGWIFVFWGNPSFKNTLFVTVVSLFYWFVLDLWLWGKREHLRTQLEQEVPHFLNLFTLILKTGMNITQTLDYLSKNKQGTLPPLIQKKLRLLQHGQSMQTVLDELKQSVCNPEFRNFITNVNRGQTLGVPLAPILEMQTDLMRTKRRQRAEEISRTAAVKITLPLVLFIFPALLLLYIGPGLLRLME